MMGCGRGGWGVDFIRVMCCVFFLLPALVSSGNINIKMPPFVVCFAFFSLVFESLREGLVVRAVDLVTLAPTTLTW